MRIDYQPGAEDYNQQWQAQRLCFMQHWAWGESKRPASTSHRVMIGNMPASILVRKLPGLGGQFGYLPRAFNEQFMLSVDLKTLASELTDQLGLSHLIIEPYVYGPEEHDISRWREENFIIDPHTVNSRHSNLLDVTKTDEELLAAMEHDARRRIKQALKRDDLTFREDNSEAGLHRFYECLHDVSKRSRFVVQNEAYFAKIYKAFEDTGMVHLLFVEREGQLLYASFALADNQILRRLYGGPTALGRQEPAGHLLLWGSVKLTRSLGLTHIDFWGVAPYGDHGFDPKHSLYGVSKFKAGFGGQNITYWPQLIWVKDKARFQTYRVMLKTHKGLIRLRKVLG